MSPDDRAPVRSYQRVFKPDWRIFQIDGHRLPVPGGVPLRWVGWALGGLLAVIALSGRSPILSLLLAATAGAAALALGGRSTALFAALGALGASQVIGFMLATLDWPMRLLVLPALVATLATQATPDGRSGRRFALSWIALQLRPQRRTLGRPLPDSGERQLLAGVVRVAPDAHGPALRRCRVRGPAVVRFAEPVYVGRGRLRRSRRRVRPAPWRGAELAGEVELRAGEWLEVAP